MHGSFSWITQVHDIVYNDREHSFVEMLSGSDKIMIRLKQTWWLEPTTSVNSLDDAGKKMYTRYILGQTTATAMTMKCYVLSFMLLNVRIQPYMQTQESEVDTRFLEGGLLQYRACMKILSHMSTFD